MPGILRQVLNSDDWTEMSIFDVKKVQTQLLLSSKEQFAAFKFSKEGYITETALFSATQYASDLNSNTLQCNYDGELFQLARIKI